MQINQPCSQQFFSNLSFYWDWFFSRDFIASSQISIFLANILKSMQILAYFWRRNFPKLQIWLFCVEDMAQDPSELIAAFVLKVPIFRGFGPGVLDKQFPRTVFSLTSSKLRLKNGKYLGTPRPNKNTCTVMYNTYMEHAYCIVQQLLHYSSIFLEQLATAIEV